MINIALQKILNLTLDVDSFNIATASLFDIVSDHIFENISDENVPILSYISRVGLQEDIDKFDMNAVENSLYMIESYFRRNPGVPEHDGCRRQVCARYSHSLLVDNYEQLVHNYNRVMSNVRKHFPGFNFGGSVFERHAFVSCYVNKCSTDEIEKWASAIQADYYDVFTEAYRDYDASTHQKLVKAYYDKDYDGSTKTKAEALISNHSGLNSLSRGMLLLLDYKPYMAHKFTEVNDFLRGVRRHEYQSEDHMVSNMSRHFTQFAPSLVLPFYTKSDIVVYRGDQVRSSPRRVQVEGVFSAALSIYDAKPFAEGNRYYGRLLKINIPKGTPVLPFSLNTAIECEIALLPGTIIERVSRMRARKGEFAEYVVVQAPPKLSELEEATIFRNHIKNMLNFEVKGDVRSAQQVIDFNLELVNSIRTRG